VTGDASAEPGDDSHGIARAAGPSHDPGRWRVVGLDEGRALAGERLGAADAVLSGLFLDRSK
jgi:hypothetical protein